MDDRWIGTGAAAKLLNISRQALLKKVGVLEFDRVARREPNGRWKFDSRRLGFVYDGVTNLRVDSPRFAVTRPQQVDDDLPRAPGVGGSDWPSDAQLRGIIHG
jgi:hypothetical protein